MKAPLLLLLLACVVLQQCSSSAARRLLAADDAAVYRLLGHPALQPLSHLAAQLELLQAATPCLLRAAAAAAAAAAGAPEAAAAACAQALRLRARQLRPILKDPAARGEAADEQARQLAEAAQAVHEAVAQSGSCAELPGLDVEEALEAAQREAKESPALGGCSSSSSSSSCSSSSSSHGLAARFVIQEFIPHSETLFSISEGIKDLGARGKPQGGAAALQFLSESWKNVKDKVAAAGSRLLQQVQHARQAVLQQRSSGEAQRLAALAKFAEKVRGQRGENSKKLFFLLNLIQFNPQDLARKLQAMQLAFEVETVLPHFQYLHSDLESAKNKLSLQTEVEGLLLRVRAQAAAALGLQHAAKEEDQMDLMAPLVRFQELENYAKSEEKQNKFLHELSHLRNRLRKLHQEAARLRK
ncbi:hypothetical protein, conserved [Eimeria necatrix]|uniref:Uncharacterized protein n=1 Tax=Eimeria necatrix TaxID=51315 RepID=U6MWN6_9EIME|nr:hypothetical protein, conserved [Eimeria necatrix]CDJ68657.1 hypothetical protein, conserved [Eimeria necatrix]